MNKCILFNMKLNKNKNICQKDVTTLLSLLSQHRCDDYIDWIKIGRCLYNIDKDYLFLWDNWSQKSNKYTVGVCDKKWKLFGLINDDFSIGTLLYYASIDSPEKFNMKYF